MKKLIHSSKDASGAYIKPDQEAAVPIVVGDISIDDLMKKGLLAIQRVMQACLIDASTGVPSRESVMNLKDIMAMLHELKKKEQELMDEMSEEELEALATKKE